MRQIISFNAHANPFFGEFFRKKLREQDPRPSPESLTSPLTEVYAVADRAGSPDAPPHRQVLDDLLLREFGMTESAEDRERKESTLLKLNSVLQMWMRRVHEKLGLLVGEGESAAGNNFARLVCYGSYKLGVSGPRGDIDTLVLAPSYVERDAHFFGLLFPLLRELARDNEAIQDLNAVNDRGSMTTPLISLCFYGTKLDLVFATLERLEALDGRVDHLGIADRANLDNDDLTRHMDDKMKSSYNGFRNAEMMLAAVVAGCAGAEERERRVTTFRTTLRCVKKIAQANGITQNKAGFLAGISLALLTVKAVQLFPNYSAPYLLERLFAVFGCEWDWDNWRVLVAPEKAPPPAAGYRPEFMSDKRYMYIFTPAHPTTNSAYNVRFSTRETILAVFRGAHAGLLAALARQQAAEAARLWRAVFREFPFFAAYEQYIELSVVGNDAQLFIQWRGFIESRVKFLVRELEKLRFYFDFEMQLWPETYSAAARPVKAAYHAALAGYAQWEKIYIGLRMKTALANGIDLTPAVAQFVSQVDSDWQHQLGRDPGIINLYIYVFDREALGGAETAPPDGADPPARAEPPRHGADAPMSKEDDCANADQLSEDDREIIDELLK